MNELMHANLQVIEFLGAILQEIERHGGRGSGDADSVPVAGVDPRPGDGRSAVRH